jgi:hypothetical protein
MKLWLALFREVSSFPGGEGDRVHGKCHCVLSLDATDMGRQHFE